uniref:DUF885 domain-containing protein n=1 Tax=viral metagenome TaxID=1070528 RepID=A0A6C0C795_9ZZZZ
MELCDKYLHDLIKLYPPSNDNIDYEEYRNKKNLLPNQYSQDFIIMNNYLNNKYYDILIKKKNKTYYDDVLLYDLKYDRSLKYFNDEYLLDINDNILFFYYDKCFNIKDYDMIMNRLSKLTTITNSMIELLKKGLKNKIYINYLIINNFIDKSKDILSKNDNFNNVPKNIRTKFKKCVDKYLIKNIKKILDFVLNNYIKYSNKNIGLYTYKNGLKCYENICKYNTLSNLTPCIIHDMGIKFLKQDILLKKELGKKLKVKDIDDYVFHNNKFYKTGKEIIKDLTDMRETLYKKLDKYFIDDIKELYDIKSISSVNMDMSAYYTSPNKKEKGKFYINIFNPEKISKYELLTLNIHEGIPGHHYENYLTYKSNLPDYIKESLYSGYSEGWAFYCESLYEYKNDFEYYYSLQYKVERSLRLIIDTGIHYYKWDFDKCFKYMKKYLKYFPDDYIKNQILRYSSNPGQALTYKIGEQVILKLKKDYLKNKNNNIKSFHKILLDIGPCPLDLLIKQFYNIII